MDTIKALDLVAATLAAAHSIAESMLVLKTPPGKGSAMSTLTRAEALADLVVWRMSGMDEVSRSEFIDWPNESFQLALARYQALHSSPEYRALIVQMRQSTFATSMLETVKELGAYAALELRPDSNA